MYQGSVQFSSVAQSCPTLCDPMNHNTPGLPVHHQLPELTQTHVHRVGDTIQPSHPLLAPVFPASNPSQHQSHFQWVNSSHEVTDNQRKNAFSFQFNKDSLFIYFFLLGVFLFIFFILFYFLNFT